MQVGKISAATATITFSRRDLLLFVSAINEAANGLHLDAIQEKRLARTKESARELLDEIFHVLEVM